jgi:hypothetical protein
MVSFVSSSFLREAEFAVKGFGFAKSVLSSEAVGLLRFSIGLAPWRDTGFFGFTPGFVSDFWSFYSSCSSALISISRSTKIGSYSCMYLSNACWVVSDFSSAVTLLMAAIKDSVFGFLLFLACNTRRPCSSRSMSLRSVVLMRASGNNFTYYINI